MLDITFDIYPSFTSVTTESVYIHKLLEKTIGWEPPSQIYNYYNWRTLYRRNLFPTGLINIALETINNKSKENPNIIVNLKYDKKSLSLSKDFFIDLRQYQKEAVNFIQNNNRGLLSMACASGKTKISLEFLLSLDPSWEVLYVVPYKQVLKQTVNELEILWNTKAIKISPSVYQINNTVIGLPISILSQVFKVEFTKNNKKLRVPSYSDIVFKYKQYIEGKIDLPYYDCLIVDEVHLIAADSLFAVSSLSNAPVRVGMSATITRTDNKEYMIYGAISNKDFSVTRKELIKLNYLPNTIYKQVPFDSSELSLADSYDLAYPQLHTSLEYNIFLKNIFEEIKEKNLLPCLYLTVSVEQANILSQLLDCRCITGVEKENYRQESVERLRNTEDLVLVASDILSTGFDCPNLQSVVLCGGGTSESLVVQRFGRLDRPYKNKVNPTIYDIKHNYKWFSKHSNLRKQLAILYDYRIENNFEADDIIKDTPKNSPLVDLTDF